MKLNMNQKAQNILSKINMFCAAYIIFWTIAPIAVGVGFLKAFVILCSVVWLLSAIILSKSLVINSKIIAPLTYAIIIYIALVSYLCAGASGFSSQVSLIIFLFYSLFYLYYKNASIQTLKNLFIFTLAIVGLFAIITLAAHIIFGDTVSRYITGYSKVYSTDLYRYGIGAYNLIFTIATLTPLLFYMIYCGKQQNLFLKSKPQSPLADKAKTDIASQLLITILFLIFIALMYLSKFSFAIITVAGGIIIILMSKLKLKVNLAIIASIIVGLSVFIILILTGSIAIPTEYYSLVSKMFSIIESIRTGELTGALADRWGLYYESIKLIPSHLWGGVIFNPNRISGGHMFLVDNIATFGIIAGSLIDFICIYVPISYIYKRKSGFSALAIAMSFSTLFVLLLDGLAHGMGAVIFVCFTFLLSKEGMLEIK
jgi:hypothetical protein